MNHNRWYNAACGWPQYFIFDRDGLQTHFICGADTPAIEAAILENLAK